MKIIFIIAICLLVVATIIVVWGVLTHWKFVCKKKDNYSEQKFFKECPKNHNLPLIIYINLDKDTLRNMQMIKLFKNLKYPQHKIIRFKGIQKSIGSEGCRLSHIAANKMAIKHLQKNPNINQKYYIICEDDIKIIKPSGNFYHQIHNIENLHQHIDMVLFECGDKLEKKLN